MTDDRNRAADTSCDLRRDGFVALVKFGAVAIAVLTLWQLQTVALLVFGAVLVAIILDAGADFASRHLRLGRQVALALVTVAIVASLAAFIVLLGNRIAGEIIEVSRTLPAAANRIEDWLGINNLEDWLAKRFEDGMAQGSVITGLSGATIRVGGAAVGLGLVLVGGLFLAISPGLYSGGMLALVPPAHRRSAGDTLAAVGNVLRLWLLGQLAAMLCIGILTTVALLWLGISSPFGLGFLAGLMAFVPYVGPVLSAVPAIAVGLADGPVTALWVCVIYIVIQQIEGIVLIPVIQRIAVHIPPAITVFTVIAFGTLFGAAGVVFAAPLSVVVMILLQRHWVEPLDRQAEPTIDTPRDPTAPDGPPERATIDTPERSGRP